MRNLPSPQVSDELCGYVAMYKHAPVYPLLLQDVIHDANFINSAPRLSSLWCCSNEALKAVIQHLVSFLVIKWETTGPVQLFNRFAGDVRT